MKKLDFQPVKSDKAFKKNYKLHDMAEANGKNLLVQWGFNFSNFGEDRRNEKVWERGEDKPDIIIEYNGKRALVDWKGKRKPKWLINERAAKSYENWREKLNMPMMIVFFVFDENNEIRERRFAVLGKNKYELSKGRQWDANKTVEFENDLPVFTAPEIIKFFNSMK
jgi:hypothetical protein